MMEPEPLDPEELRVAEEMEAEIAAVLRPQSAEQRHKRAVELIGEVVGLRQRLREAEGRTIYGKPLEPGAAYVPVAELLAAETLLRDAHVLQERLLARSALLERVARVAGHIEHGEGEFWNAHRGYDTTWNKTCPLCSALAALEDSDDAQP